MGAFPRRLQYVACILTTLFVATSHGSRLPRAAKQMATPMTVGTYVELGSHRSSAVNSSLLGAQEDGTNSGTDSFKMLEKKKKKKEQQMFLMCGYPLPAWVVAVSVCISASVLTVIGFVLQKKGANAPGDHWRIGDVVLSKEWISGFILIVCAGFPLDLLAYSLAPMSLTTPLSGVTVALNMALAPRLLGEVVQSWPDAAATGLIVGGTLITTASGAHEEPEYDSQRLSELLGNDIMQGCILVLLAVITICVGIMMYWRNELAKSAQRRSINPNVLEVLLPSVVAGGAGCLTNIALKAVGVLLRSSGPGIEVFIWSICVVIPAVVQLNYLNRGLQLYPQTVFLPIYTAILVLLSTIVGAIFYQEQLELMAQPRWQHLFAFGVLWIVGGIAMFTFREPGQSDNTDAAALLNKGVRKAPTRAVESPPAAEVSCGEAHVAG